MLRASISRNSPANFSSSTSTSNGSASASRKKSFKASRPISMRIGLGGLGPLCAIASAIDPPPTASRKFRSPQGPFANPTSKYRVFAFESPDSRPSTSPSIPRSGDIIRCSNRQNRDRDTVSDVAIYQATGNFSHGPIAARHQHKLPIFAESGLIIFLLDRLVGRGQSGLTCSLHQIVGGRMRSTSGGVVKEKGFHLRRGSRT
jgi:hypothetical protein